MCPDFLFARPSWLSGAARTLDLAGQFDEYNESPNEEIADRRALFVDWRIIGETLFDAVKAFGREQAPQSPSTE
jgi:hypothetical protein